MLPNLSGLRVGGLGGCGREGRRCAPVGMVILAADQDDECTICTGPLRSDLGNDAAGRPRADPRLPQIVADGDLVQWSWNTATLVCGHTFHRRCLATVFHAGVPLPWDCPRKFVNIQAHQGIKANLSQADIADIVADRAVAGFNNHLTQAQAGVFIPTAAENQRQNSAREQARALQEASAHANQAQQAEAARQQAVQAAEAARAQAEAEQAAGRAAQQDAAQQAAEAAEARKQAERTKAALKQRENALDQREAREAAARAEMAAAFERRDAELRRLRAEADARCAEAEAGEQRAACMTAELERRRAEFERAKYLAEGGPMQAIEQKAQAQRHASPKYVDAVQQLRSKHPNMDEAGFAKAMRGLLLDAVDGRDVGFVRAAILDGADPRYTANVTRGEGGAPELAAPLWNAAASGHLSIVEAIVEMSEMNVDWVPENVEEGAWSEWQKEATAFARAALNGHVDVVRYLMGKGAAEGDWLERVTAEWGRGVGTQDEGVRFEVKLLLSRVSEAMRAFYDRALAIEPTQGELQTLEFLGMTTNNFNVAVRDHVMLLPKTLESMEHDAATATVEQVNYALEFQSLKWASIAREETDVPDDITLSIFRQLGVEVNFMHVMPTTEEPSTWPWITMLRAAVFNVLPERAKALIDADADPNLQIKQSIWRGAYKNIKNHFPSGGAGTQQDHLIKQLHMSPLMIAFQGPNTEEATLLLNVLYEAGASPAFVGREGLTFNKIASMMASETNERAALANLRVPQLLQNGSPSDREFGDELLAKAKQATPDLEALEEDHGDLLVYSMKTPLIKMVLHPVLWVYHALADWLYPFGPEQWQLSGENIAQALIQVIGGKVRTLGASERGTARDNPQEVAVEELRQLRRLFWEFDVSPNFRVQLDDRSDAALVRATQNALQHTSGRTHATTFLGTAAMLPRKATVQMDRMVVEMLLNPLIANADPNWSPVPLEEDSMFPVDFLPPLAVATLMDRPELHDLLLEWGASPQLITRWTYEESTKKMHPLAMWNRMRMRNMITPEDFVARHRATRAAVPRQAMEYGDEILRRARVMEDQVLRPSVVEQVGTTPWMSRELWEKYLYSLLWEEASKSSPEDERFLKLVAAARELDLKSSKPHDSLPPGPSLLAKLAEKNNITAMEYMLDKWDGDIEYPPDPKQADRPLLAAVKEGAMVAVEWLLERGANRNVEDGSGHTPLDVAKQNGNVALAKLLEGSASSSRGSSVRRKKTGGRRSIRQ